MNAKVIGIGAAGNKAAITLIEKQVIDVKDVLLLNSTLKDVPDDYKSIAHQFSGSVSGCGKQRDIAQDLVINAIKEGSLDLDSVMDPTDSTVIIVSSSEGGTGCGASTVIAKYFKEVLGVNVHMFVFTGFEDDGRGLQNTVEYFQEISDAYTVEAISNKKFLEIAGTRSKAEALANEAFAMRVKILLGQIIVDSKQNIDDTDLYKTATFPGFMMIDFIKLDKIRNMDDFNKTLVRALDDTKSLEVAEPSAAKLAVIFNISEKTEEYVDLQAQVLRERLGFPYEYFLHVQHEGDTEFVAFIASGMKMPIDEIKEVYNRYQEASKKVNKTADDFFATIGSLRGNDDDAKFNMAPREAKRPNNADKKKFFEGFGVEPPLNPQFQNVQHKQQENTELNKY